MIDFYAQALRSGSAGNSYLMSYGGGNLVVDCGVNGKQFARALADAGIPEDKIASSIAGILVTHEHSDHTCGLGVVMRRYGIPIYLNAKTYQAVQKKLGKINEDLVHIIDTGVDFSLQDFNISAFHVSHDAADPVGYSISTPQGKVALCTDTGIVNDDIKEHIVGANLVFMESNYEPNLLQVGPYPYRLKQRIAGKHGHLSNQLGAQTCRWLLERGTEHFVLSHLSQTNNYPQIAELVAEENLNLQDAKRGLDYTLHVANRYRVSKPILVGGKD